MISLFKRHTKEEHADTIADNLPNGPLWTAKRINGKKLRSLLLGFARTLRTGEDKLETVWEQLDPSTTTDFIDEWESALGIPDDCFQGTGSLETRRTHVVAKLTAAIQTADDFVALAALLGVAITIQSGVESSTFPLTFPILFFDTLQDARFTMIVNFTASSTVVFPLTFPIVFPDDNMAVIRCFFDKLKPANTDIIYREV
jgi:uncharacterized protein YmfQ (DUF2313 family)